MPRFFVERITHPAVLSDLESRHAVRSLRLSSGDRVVVFDPHESWTGEIESIQGRVRIRLVEKLPAPSIPTVRIASAVPKGARLDWMVEKLAELGVAEWAPVRFARSVAELGESKRRRLEKLALAAAKQSGAPVMRIGAERGVEDLPPEAALAHPAGEPALPPRGGLVIVGPEGGVTSAEEGRFARRFTLGPTILRIETAAVVAAARLLP
ncbi:MAG TPA: RsmE family RNA methyltransferase [Planctomycetota bacterium]|nr:RsmE family RNA methyltransferase [Planctomycetota bacterium]